MTSDGCVDGLWGGSMREQRKKCGAGKRERVRYGMLFGDGYVKRGMEERVNGRGRVVGQQPPTTKTGID